MSAVFSPCGRYRYTLERSFPGSLFASRGLVAWIALNPSTATETVNDPTIRREMDFSARWGFHAMRKLNLYAYRSTVPDVLKTVDDPVGPDNDRHLVEGTADAALIVCGWGTKAVDDRPARVTALLRAAGRRLHCLRLTKDGFPEHPLYLPSELVPIPFGGAL